MGVSGALSRSVTHEPNTQKSAVYFVLLSSPLCLSRWRGDITGTLWLTDTGWPSFAVWLAEVSESAAVYNLCISMERRN